jgi:acyl carrier protein
MRTATMFGDMLGLTEGDEWLVTRPATGAAAPWEMWVAPLRGGCTIIAPGIQHDPVELARITGLDSVAVVSVTRREARQLAGVIRGRGRLVSATRTDTEVTLWSATGERIGRTDHGETRTGASASLMVDGIPVNPADIEAPLLDLPGVTSCIVRQQGDESLYAVVGTTAYKSVRDLTRILRSSMPETMVPEVALAESEAATITPRQLQFGPEIRRLWSQVLSVPEVPLDTPFFDLGGNSLLLFVVLSELKKQGWTTVEMTDLLAYPTVRSLSRRLCRSDDPTPAQSPASAHQGRNAIAARRERGRM